MRRSTCATSRTRTTRARGAEIEEDDLNTAFYENDEIDLGQLMQEQFYLVLPMKPLCSENCKGLCPNCGEELEPRDVRLQHRMGGPVSRRSRASQRRILRTMPNPKRRHSKTRTAKRRTHDALTAGRPQRMPAVP